MTLCDSLIVIGLIVVGCFVIVGAIIFIDEEINSVDA